MKRRHDYSQHFLRNPKLVHELIGHSNIKKSDTVYDLGAGSGIISSALAKRAGQVFAVESEPKTAAKLRTNMARYKNITTIEKDILQIDLPQNPYKVFANIPFHLSSQIIRYLTEADNPPRAIYLIVQKQFANKLLPDSTRFTSQLGMMVGPLFAVRIRKPLRRTDFWPHPNVDTVLIELKLRDEPLIATNDMPRYRSFTRTCFSDPRQFAKTPLEGIGLPAHTKPSQMTLTQWVELFASGH